MKSLSFWLAFSFLVHVLFIALSFVEFNFEKRQRLELSLLKNKATGSEQAPTSRTFQPPGSAETIATASEKIGGLKNSKFDQNLGQVENSDRSENASGGIVSVRGEDVGIQTHYPKASRVLGESGEVQVNLKKNAIGQIENISVGRSSGFPRLDQAALESVKTQLNQEKLKNIWGKKDRITLTFIFELTN